ncbi:hypothetical protein GE061_010833 [Apolygus lucorum]|uniref:Gustatory receptor n=1 Tax=Apolygus lucorum TaxID=248454 RepID=A0A8S9XXX3_APOLU|nr:hypothetical protein GE061_010833 [Apolygus lucorum]
MSLHGAIRLHMAHFIPVFLPSIVFGLMPCSPNPYASKVLLAYSILLHVAYRCTYVWVLLLYIRQYPDMDLPLITLLCTVCLFKASCSFSHLFGMIKERQKFVTLVQSCFKDDFTRNRFSFLTVVGMFLWPVPLLVRLTATGLRWVNVLYAIGGIFDIVCVFIIAMQYCTLLEISTKRFTAAKFTLFMQVCKLEKATDIHQDILNFTMMIHSIYGRTILVEVCYLGFDFIVAFYDSLQSIRLHGQYVWGVCTFFYSIGCLTSIYIVCNACERVKRKAEKFNSELFRLMRENKELCKNEKLQLYVTMKQTVNFTACGFFTLGYPLVTSIIAAATTYLVILVQFRFIEFGVLDSYYLLEL